MDDSETAEALYACDLDFTSGDDLARVAAHVEKTAEDLQIILDGDWRLTVAKLATIKDAMIHLTQYATELGYEQERCG
jgi:hypothetical protein